MLSYSVIFFLGRKVDMKLLNFLTNIFACVALQMARAVVGKWNALSLESMVVEYMIHCFDDQLDAIDGVIVLSSLTKAKLDSKNKVVVHAVG